MSEPDFLELQPLKSNRGSHRSSPLMFSNNSFSEGKTPLQSAATTPRSTPISFARPGRKITKSIDSLPAYARNIGASVADSLASHSTFAADSRGGASSLSEERYVVGEGIKMKEAHSAMAREYEQGGMQAFGPNRDSITAQLRNMRGMQERLSAKHLATEPILKDLQCDTPGECNEEAPDQKEMMELFEKYQNPADQSKIFHDLKALTLSIKTFRLPTNERSDRLLRARSTHDILDPSFNNM